MDPHDFTIVAAPSRRWTLAAGVFVATLSIAVVGALVFVSRHSSALSSERGLSPETGLSPSNEAPEDGPRAGDRPLRDDQPLVPRGARTPEAPQPGSFGVPFGSSPPTQFRPGVLADDPSRGDRPRGRGGQSQLAMRESVSPSEALKALLRARPGEAFDLEFAEGQPGTHLFALHLRDLLIGGGWTSENTTTVPSPPAGVQVHAARRTPGVEAFLSWARDNGLPAELRIAPGLPRVRVVVGRLD